MDSLKTLKIGGQTFKITDEAAEKLCNAILDPDGHPVSTTADTVQNITMELGGIGTTSGSNSERTDAVRSVGYLKVTPGTAVYFTNSIDSSDKLRIIAYDADKNFVETIYRYINAEFSIKPEWEYLRFYRSDTSDTSITATLVTKGTVTKAEHEKIYFANHGYVIKGGSIDSPDMHKLVIEALGKDENTYNIVELKAPANAPDEATLCLMNSGGGKTQFVDFSSMTYGNKCSVEIVNQSRGNTPLPEFSIRFNDGKGAGRVRKLVVQPDAIPIELTSAGLKVRKNNNYNNTGTADEYVTVNLADLLSRVAALESAVFSTNESGTNEPETANLSE